MMSAKARNPLFILAASILLFGGVSLAACGSDDAGEEGQNQENHGSTDTGDQDPGEPHRPGADTSGEEDARAPGAPDAGPGGRPDAGERPDPPEEPDPPSQIDVGGCDAMSPGPLPAAELPQVDNQDNEYTVELERWGISNNKRDPEATTDGLNEAIAWASDNGYGTVRLPAGEYLVGKKVNDNYSGALVLPGNIAFKLDDDAVLQMAPNDSWNYCVVEVSGKEDVIITGGTIRGERDEHEFSGGGAHDEGHTICIWEESERVLVEKTTLRDGTGDGVLIVGGGESGSSKDITIRDNEIFNHRRQGVSIVGGINVVIEHNAIHHISGTAPQFGVDIESLSYTSRDILIHKNEFYQNQGGDYVNTDGLNVWLLDNTMDQTGLEDAQTDGPIVHWQKTDQVIRGNEITVTVGSSNGRWGIIGYTNGERKNEAPNFIEDNVFHGGGIHMADTRLMKVSGNEINDWSFLGTDVSCLQFDDNAVNYDQIEPYKFRRIKGRASGNLLNGEPEDLPMSPDEEFTNSPPHMW